MVTHTDRNGIVTTHARVRVGTAGIDEPRECARVLAEKSGRRRTAKYALVTRGLVGGEPVDDIAAVIIDVDYKRKRSDQGVS